MWHFQFQFLNLPPKVQSANVYRWTFDTRKCTGLETRAASNFVFLLYFSQFFAIFQRFEVEKWVFRIFFNIKPRKLHKVRIFHSESLVFRPKIHFHCFCSIFSISAFFIQKMCISDRFFSQKSEKSAFSCKKHIFKLKIAFFVFLDSQVSVQSVWSTFMMILTQNFPRKVCFSLFFLISSRFSSFFSRKSSIFPQKSPNFSPSPCGTWSGQLYKT